MTDSQAYAEGFDAFQAGIDVGANPYDKDREAAWRSSWGSGWREARKKDYEESHGMNITTNNSNKSPWWFYGFQFVIFCFYTYYMVFRNARNLDHFCLMIMGVYLCFMLFQFIREFFKQHAQYTIKSLLILTFCVAVLCSIYSCFGFHVVFWIIFLGGALMSMWVRNRYKK
jgi:hypothetical protein